MSETKEKSPSKGAKVAPYLAAVVAVFSLAYVVITGEELHTCPLPVPCTEAAAETPTEETTEEATDVYGGPAE